MSYILAIFFAVMGAGGMARGLETDYWMGAWLICALFTIAGNISYSRDRRREDGDT